MSLSPDKRESFDKIKHGMRMKRQQQKNVPPECQCQYWSICLQSVNRIDLFVGTIATCQRKGFVIVAIGPRNY